MSHDPQDGLEHEDLNNLSEAEAIELLEVCDEHYEANASYAASPEEVHPDEF